MRPILTRGFYAPCGLQAEKYSLRLEEITVRSAIFSPKKTARSTFYSSALVFSGLARLHATARHVNPSRSPRSGAGRSHVAWLAAGRQNSAPQYRSATTQPRGAR